jgi:hypothetical protein
MPSNTKDITRFVFPGVINTETVIGAVPDADGTYPISVWVPSGIALGNLAPAITHTGAGIDPPEGTGRNFNVPQMYTVTAEDGTVKTYKVTVDPSSGDTKVITGFVFETVPLINSVSDIIGAVRAVGSIDQSTKTITVVVPPDTTDMSADITGLSPTITYIGRSITAPTVSGTSTENPFTDTEPLDFSFDKAYTVNPQNGAGQTYNVTVIKQSPVTVTFEGDVDQTVVASNTSSGGVITITVNNDASNGVAPPYEWYVDGIKQSVSSTATTFTLNVGNGTFIPGRHEITVSGKKDGLHYTGKVYFAVSK